MKRSSLPALLVAGFLAFAVIGTVTALRHTGAEQPTTASQAQVPSGPAAPPPDGPGPGGGTPPGDYSPGPCEPGGALYGTPDCAGVPEGNAVGPCAEGGAYFGDPDICGGLGGGTPPAGGAGTPAATPPPTTSATPGATAGPGSGTPTGDYRPGPCEVGGVLYGTPDCEGVREGLRPGPCAEGGAYVNDPSVCGPFLPAGSATPSATSTPRATTTPGATGTPPATATASATPRATATATATPRPTTTAVPTATPTGTTGTVVGVLPPPGIGACPGPNCPYGPDWTPPCVAGGPLAGTVECELTLAGQTVGPCAPGGSAYGDADICPWTVSGAAIASSGGFFGVTPAGTPTAGTSGALTSAVGALATLGGARTAATPTPTPTATGTGGSAPSAAPSSTPASTPAPSVTFAALGAGSYTPGQFLWGITAAPTVTPTPAPTGTPSGTPPAPVVTFPAPLTDPFGATDPFAPPAAELDAFYDVPLGDPGEIVTPWALGLIGGGGTPVAGAFAGAIGIFN